MLYLMRGQVYELEGYHFYTWMMQKVTTPITNHQINHVSWWQQDLPSNDE